MAKTHRGVSIRVEGLKELRKDLKAVGDAEEQSAFKAALNEAARLIVDRSQASASTRQERSMASRLKASKGAATSAVTIGGKPYDLGTEFGAKRWPQFRPWRGNDTSAGYLVFPTIRDAEDEIADKFGDAIDRILEGRGAGAMGGAERTMGDLSASIGRAI